jgi:hypothetical protein
LIGSPGVGIRPLWADLYETRAVYAVFSRFTTAFTGEVSVHPVYGQGMRWPLSLLLVLLPIAALALSRDVRAFAAELIMHVHGAFVVVFVDAANFVKGCF